MRFEVSGEGEDLLFVLGWGNRHEHDAVAWLVDRLAERYRVHAAQIPTNVRSFEREYLDPVAEYAADLGEFRLLGHSTGGLIGAHLRGERPTPEERVYLSPWWGYTGLPDAVLEVVARIPTDRVFLPGGESSRADRGELVSERALRESPDRVSPTFVRETRRAQATLPPFDTDAAVFCTLTDSIVSVRAIGERAPASNVRVYDGGHELFASPSREQHLPTLLDCLEAGAAALD
jgi:pimeloyl-ACP methyl ester carboxylesterase